jgi:hypothetical protein
LVLIFVTSLGLLAVLANRLGLLGLNPAGGSVDSLSKSLQLPNAQIGAEVDRLMEGILRGDYPEGPTGYEGGGWLMTLPDGRVIDRNGLRLYATHFIKRGADAVPGLFKWVLHENLAIRYIAAYSLEQITGIASGIFWFDAEDQERHRETAIRAWKYWWENHSE